MYSSLFIRCVGRRIWIVALLSAPLISCHPESKAVNIAVATNFAEPSKEIAAAFEKATGYKTLLSFGSTGQFLTQITQDAPFEVFLAADQDSPRKAIAAGLAVEDSVFTYAIGKVVLFGTNADLTGGEAVLRGGKFEKIAIANPETAPYGAAALETMKSLGLYEQLMGKIVEGNNIAQAFQFVETGNAQIGFVALSQVVGKDPKSVWLVPESLYSPIRQDAVLLKKGAASEGARSLMTFLKSPDSLKIIEKYGYRTAP